MTAHSTHYIHLYIQIKRHTSSSIRIIIHSYLHTLSEQIMHLINTAFIKSCNILHYIMSNINPKQIELALYMPEIPQNTGTLIRTCAAFNATLHIIHPCGFIWSDKLMTRSHMDYIQYTKIIHHNTYADFEQLARSNNQRILATICHTMQSYNAFTYQSRDIILCGQESIGLPTSISDPLQHITIFTQPHTRSLNLAIAGSIILAHAIH